MNPKYRYLEVFSNQISLPITLSRKDILRMIGDPSKTEEENNTLVDNYIKSKNATRIYDHSFNEYQIDTRITAVYPKDQAHSYLALGLASEAGEVAGKLKKVIRDYSNTPLDQMSPEWKKEYLSEIGDVLWYIARISDELGVSLSEVADANISKLLDRLSRNKINGNGDNR
jgi:NTP pyrophosphatase (non-canonical NTP hydrolase)